MDVHRLQKLEDAEASAAPRVDLLRLVDTRGLTQFNTWTLCNFGMRLAKIAEIL